MIAYGLTTRRTGPSAARTSRVASHRLAPSADRERSRPARVPLAADEQRRMWSRDTLLELGCGWERGRVIIPIRNGHGELRGVLRYAPTHDRAPKMLAVRGTQLGLIPHPAAEPSSWVVLVEGPPDMISARSQGLRAIAVPGDDAWEPEWARLLVGRYVSVCLIATERAARPRRESPAT
jgi:hypothetical protein